MKGICMQKCRLCGLKVLTMGRSTHEASRTCQQMVPARRQHMVVAQGKAMLHTSPSWCSASPLNACSSSSIWGALSLTMTVTVMQYKHLAEVCVCVWGGGGATLAGEERGAAPHVGTIVAFVFLYDNKLCVLLPLAYQMDFTWRSRSVSFCYCCPISKLRPVLDYSSKNTRVVIVQQI